MIPIFTAENIMWDASEEEMLGANLPTSIIIPDGELWDEESISDYISSVTGFCHEGFIITCNCSREELTARKIELENILNKHYDDDVSAELEVIENAIKVID